MYRFLIVSLLFVSCQSNNNKKLPEFSKKTLSGKTISNKNLIGKTVVVKVWATWCGSCIAEIPALNELVAKYKSDTNIVFLSITDDKEEKIKSFLDKNTFNYEHITDSKSLKGKFYTGFIQEIPKHLVINPKGDIVYESSGEIENINTVLGQVISNIK